VSEAAQRTDDSLTLRVENLGLGHHMNNNPGHWGSSDAVDGAELILDAGLIRSVAQGQEPM
jgi:hypothetical protein